jgi:hypothetical protein
VVTTGSPAAVFIPTGPAWAAVARAAALPGAVAVPVAAVTRFTVEEAVIVAAAPFPVVAPARVPELPRTPVVIGQRGHRLGLSDARRANAGKSKTRDDGSRSCDSFDVYHSFFVPPAGAQLNV